MEKYRRKVGIMGGTFDPIHIGHLILGEKAYEQFQLEEVLFMPAGNPPHKKKRPGRATDEERVEMVRRAISFNPHFRLSLDEMNEDGYTYTYRTLEKLNNEYPDTDYYFIIGADSLFNFDTWMKPERICNACKIVVATRNHTAQVELEEKIRYLKEMFGGEFHILNTLNMDVSSHMIRQWIQENKSIRYYVPDEVSTYIYEQNMYQQELK